MECLGAVGKGTSEAITSLWPSLAGDLCQGQPGPALFRGSRQATSALPQQPCAGRVPEAPGSLFASVICASKTLAAAWWTAENKAVGPRRVMHAVTSVSRL